MQSLIRLRNAFLEQAEYVRSSYGLFLRSHQRLENFDTNQSSAPTGGAKNPLESSRASRPSQGFIMGNDPGQLLRCGSDKRVVGSFT